MITIPVSIPVSDLAASVSKEYAEDIILEIDSNIAEVDFSLSILKKLINSLSFDMNLKDIQEELFPNTTPQ